MQIGLVGYGAWGQRHAAAIERLDGLELKAVVAASAETRTLAERAHPHARVFSTYQEALADADIEMIDVVTPNYLHAEIGCAALAAGKHVLLEKPMGVSVAECDRLIAAEAASGKRLSVGYELRLSSQWGRVKQEIDAGRIGVPRHVSVGLFRNAYRPGASGWRMDPKRVGAWSLEETVHFFDLVLWYLHGAGSPEVVQAVGVPSTDRPTLYETLCAQIRFGGGATAAISHTTGGFGHSQWVEVVGTEGAIRTSWQGRMDRDETPAFSFQIRPKGFPFERGVNEFEAIHLDPSGELVELERELAMTAAAFRRGEALASAADARRGVQLCLAAETAARTGAPVRLNG